MNIKVYKSSLYGRTAAVSLILAGSLLSTVLVFILLTPRYAWAHGMIESQNSQSPTIINVLASKDYVKLQPLHRPLNITGTVLSESFDDSTFPPASWGTTIVTGTIEGWSRVTSGVTPSAPPHSGIGMARFNAWSLPSGYSTRLYTPLLDLTGQITPTLQFWMYHDTGFSGENDRVQVQISTDGGTNYNTLTTISRYDGSTGWKQHTIDLSAYSGQNNVRLGLLGISDFGNNIFIDDIEVGLPAVDPVSTLFLPIIAKSPSSPGGTPIDGHWVGTTSRNFPVSFDVLSNGTLWATFVLETDFACGTIKMTINTVDDISNNQFSFSSSTFSFTGQFTSPATAQGTYTFTNLFTGCGPPFSQTGTWTATPQ